MTESTSDNLYIAYNQDVISVYHQINKDKFKSVLTKVFKEYLDQNLDKLINYYEQHVVLRERGKSCVYILDEKFDPSMNEKSEQRFTNYIRELFSLFTFPIEDRKEYADEFYDSFPKIDEGLHNLLRISLSAYLDSIVDSQLLDTDTDEASE